MIAIQLHALSRVPAKSVSSAVTRTKDLRMSIKRSSHQTKTPVSTPQRKPMSPAAARRSNGLHNAHCGGTQECAEQARIKEMQLGRLYQKLQLVPEPRFHPTNEKQLLQNRDILPRGLVVKSNLAAHLREIGELARVAARTCNSLGIGQVFPRRQLRVHPAAQWPLCNPAPMSGVALDLRAAAFRGSRQSARLVPHPRRPSVPQVCEVCHRTRLLENPVFCLGFQPARGAKSSRSPCGQLGSPMFEAQSKYLLSPSTEIGRLGDCHPLTS